MAKKKYTFCKIQATSASFKPPEGEKSGSVMVDLKVVDCDDPSRIGQTISEFFSLSGGATEYTVKNLRALGWSCNDITELEGVGSIIAKGGLYEDNYNPDKPRDACSVFAPPPAVEGDAKKKFAAQFKAAAVKTKAVAVSEDNKAMAVADLPVRSIGLEFESAESTEDIPF